MRTEITKSYSWGFVATEQDYRRLIQTATDHLLKPAGAVLQPTKLTIKLKDGSIVQTQIVDDLFKIENIGNKTVREVLAELSSTHANGECLVKVELKDGAANEKNWDSASYTVTGDTRDWAFVAASDLDERLKRMKVIAWEAVFAKKWTSLALMFAVMMLALLGSTYLKTPDTTYVELESLYKTGKLANATEALIALERIKAHRSDIAMMIPIFSVWIALFVVIVGGGYLLPRVSPSYNFYWGEYVGYFDKRIRVRNAVFTLVLLSLVVSVLGNFVSKKLGI